MLDQDQVVIHAPDEDQIEFHDGPETPGISRKNNSMHKGKSATEPHIHRKKLGIKQKLTKRFNVSELEKATRENKEADRMFQEQELKVKILQQKLQAEEKKRKMLKLQQVSKTEKGEN